MTLLGVVPARGGSKRLRRKNLLPLGGKPLVLIAAENLKAVCDRVVISTDDVEIESVALSHGFEVHKRDSVDDSQTVAECAKIVVADLGWDGDVLLLQPTVPYPGDLSRVMLEGPNLDRPGGPRQGWVDDWRHQWHESDGGFAIRTGVYWWPAGRIGEDAAGKELAVSAGLDIDTVEDYAVARLRAGRKRILIEYAESESIGTGHRWRAETLAAALQHHDVEMAIKSGDRIYRTSDTLDDEFIEVFDLVITDTLDNDVSVPGLWVTFEDHGKASWLADMVVNSLYPERQWAAFKTGPDWAVLRPEFQALPPFEIQAEATRVLVMFGGTDPSGLLDLAREAAVGCLVDPPIEYSHFDFVKPGDQRPVAATMRANDLLITSAGRTVYEAAAVGIPTIVLAQNNREATHVHLGPAHGNIYLGLGRLVSRETLRHTVEQVASDRALRQELSDTARKSIDGKGLARIVHAIDGLLEGL